MKKTIIIIAVILLTAGICFLPTLGEQESTTETPVLLTEKDNPYSPLANYKAYKQERKKAGHSKSEMPEIYAQIAKDKRTPIDLNSPQYGPNQILEELAKASISKNRDYKSANDYNFIERGPNNVAGRTRALLVLPSDPTQNTWLAGSASGGIWKTTDGGTSWVNKTNDFPSLGTNTLAMSASDPNTIYAGTGEFFTNDIDGFGIFKSTDAGESWTQIVKAGDYDAFRNISRMIVDPNDANVVVATARNSIFEDSLRASIYKTIDGGITWEQKLLSVDDRYDDIDFNPENFNTMYVAVRRQGVIKSTDGGETWEDRSAGFQVNGRIEISTSAVDTNIIWGLAQGNRTSENSDLYLSQDGGANWDLVADNTPIDYLTGQGWYDNIIMAHPFASNSAYMGGVNLFKVEVNTSNSNETLSSFIDDQGAFEFLDMINAIRVDSASGGIYPHKNYEIEDRLSIEIRFGESQMAHRFSVNGRGAGVPEEDYAYQDYVEIPFQVWDKDNDRQLMVSFRDQADDGAWNLKQRTLDADSTANDSREYIFVHQEPYDTISHESIARDGGIAYQQQYLIWPIERSGATYDPDTSTGSFSVDIITINQFRSNTTVLSDAYNDFNGNNESHHPDQHGIIVVIDNAENQTFKLITTNDGGVYETNTGIDPGINDGDFTYKSLGYNTTQFYSADKMPREDRYIGGMQDNSTWFTSEGETDGIPATFEFAFGGDGFEAIWNNRDPQQMIGSIQFNSFQRSEDGGATWSGATTGLVGDGPFISRLANSRALPDRLFTVNGNGTAFSNDFGRSWTEVPINDMWSFNNSVDIEVSPADPDVVWAGGALDETRRLFVSNDGGRTYSPTNYYQNEDLGFCSGFGLDPQDTQTAYALFSFARRAKVLKTTDQGQTWTDISGFDTGSGVSNRGFPDVAVECLLVFPDDTNHIWVGSEIGIIETLDGGASWHLLDANLPAVSVHDLKIQDDQIVVATYGRGIWSVQVEGVARSYIFGPIVEDVLIHPSGGIRLSYANPNPFDSLAILIDGESQQILPAGEEGTFDIDLDEVSLVDGEHIFQMIGYFDGQQYKSSSIAAEIFAPRAPVNVYLNKFDIDSMKNDFVGKDFSVGEEKSFQNECIHSPHPYEPNQDYTYMLKQPILVSDNQIFTYRDVAIIETGETGSQYPDQDFYDYVVVEGSKDGVTWQALFDGYDANSNTRWLRAYNDSRDGNLTMFVRQEVDLKDVFEVDDVIFIRFRLHSDPGVEAWGWAIDDVEVKLTTPVLDPKAENISVYPNPTSDYLQITLPIEAEAKELIVSDISGKLLYQADVSREQVHRMDVSSFDDGLIMIQILDTQRRLIRTESVVVIK